MYFILFSFHVRNSWERRRRRCVCCSLYECMYVCVCVNAPDYACVCLWTCQFRVELLSKTHTSNKSNVTMGQRDGTRRLPASFCLMTNSRLLNTCDCMRVCVRLCVWCMRRRLRRCGQLPPISKALAEGSAFSLPLPLPSTGKCQQHTHKYAQQLCRCVCVCVCVCVYVGLLI